MAGPVWAPRPALNVRIDSVCLADSRRVSDTDGRGSESQGQICRVQGQVIYHAGIHRQSMKDPEEDRGFQRTTGLLPVACVSAPPPLSPRRA